jgi:hypothetical protein
MPVRPCEFKLECGKCNWSHVFAPRSDVLLEGVDIRTRCPRCGARELNRHNLNLFERIAHQLKIFSGR